MRTEVQAAVYLITSLLNHRCPSTNNCRVLIHNDVAEVRTTKQVRAGEELWIDYGNDVSRRFRCVGACCTGIVSPPPSPPPPSPPVPVGLKDTEQAAETYALKEVHTAATAATVATAATEVTAVTTGESSVGSSGGAKWWKKHLRSQ